VSGAFFIGGEWVAASTSRALPVWEAATGQPLGEVVEAGAADVDRAVSAARRALPGWAATAPEERAAALLRLADAVTRRSGALSTLVARQNGMPLALCAAGNVGVLTQALRYYAELAAEGCAREQRRARSYHGSVHVRRVPFGVVAAIVPWNYPLGLAGLKLAPALAAGCTVVLKPAPETSLDAALLMDAVTEAALPPGVVNLVTGAAGTGQALVRHPGVDKVSFTGSTSAGRRVASACGAALRPVTLELGGKSAAIVLDDADPARVLRRLAFLSFVHAGQSCFLHSRVLVARSRYAEMVDGLAALADGFVLGDPLDPVTTMGPLVSARQRDRVEGFIAAGRAEGARLVAGGGRPADRERGWFVRPTVFANVDNAGMTVAREEIFGPVVCVLPYDSEEQAVAIANDCAYGLAGTVFSADPQRALGVAQRVEAGTVGVNLWTLDPAAPFGGVKASGLGREYGPEGLAAYQSTRAVLVPDGI
jgi:aldehyde dehydrogenase (NAD+)